MGVRERDLRSRLSQLSYQSGLLRGSLSVRKRTCGKPGCKCTRGKKHVSLYLVVSERGKYLQLFVPKHLESLVRSWVENYRHAQEILERVCCIYLKKIQKREGL
jgi:hypothetical protein